MLDAGKDNDIWTVKGQHVSKIRELIPKWSLWKGYRGQPSTHKDHFTWTGSDMFGERKNAADHLVHYLNLLKELSPNEPLSIIAHSHGCNVVKMASSDKNLSPSIYFERVVFLAYPHFKVNQGDSYHYRLAPERFGAILNLSSEKDSVQDNYAAAFAGTPGSQTMDYLPPDSYREDQDPEVRWLYQNYEIPTEDKGPAAHTVMHGWTVGYMIGLWLASGTVFKSILEKVGKNLLPVPSGDIGETK